jgi:endonuclease YncB( thermonuclease family)
MRPAVAFWDPITAQCTAPPLEGSAAAIDGDTLALEAASGHRTVIRLVGVEAPELFQDCRDADGLWACGRASKQALDDLVAGRTLACVPCGHEGDGALTALCRDGDSDIGAAMVRTGLATSAAFFSNALHAAEVDARLAGRGLWRGDWVHPQAWREGARLGEGPCRGCLVPR